MKMTKSKKLVPSKMAKALIKLCKSNPNRVIPVLVFYQGVIPAKRTGLGL